MNDFIKIILGQLGAFLFIFSILGFVFLNNKKLLKVEKGRKLLFESKCGAYIGITKADFPLGRIRIYKDLIAVRAVKSAVLNPLDIVSLKPYHFWIFSGFYIKHEDATQPKRVLVVSFNNKKIIETLKEIIPNLVY